MNLFLIAVAVFILVGWFVNYMQKQREAASPYFGCDKSGKLWQSGTGGSGHVASDGGGYSCGHGGGDGGGCGGE